MTKELKIVSGLKVYPEKSAEFSVIRAFEDWIQFGIIKFNKSEWPTINYYNRQRLAEENGISPTEEALIEELWKIASALEENSELTQSYTTQEEKNQGCRKEGPCREQMRWNANFNANSAFRM